MTPAMRNMGTTMRSTDWVLLVLLGAIWGGVFSLAAVALKEVPPLTVVGIRVLIAALVLAIAVRAIGLTIPTDAVTWGAFFVMGAFNNLVPFGLIFWGQTRIPSGLAAILNAATPLFVAILCHFLTRDEKLTTNRLSGVLIGILGVAVTIGIAHAGALGLDPLAQGAVLLAAFSYASAGVFGRRFRGLSFIVVAFGQATAATLLALPLVLIVDRPWTLAVPGPTTWAALVCLGVVGTALGHSIYFRILATAGATNVLLVTLLMPASAVLLGTLVLGERLEPHHLAGMAVIALGLIVIDGRVVRRMRRVRLASRP